MPRDVYEGGSDVLGGGGGSGGGGTPTKVGATTAALGSGTADGDLGLLRIGTWPNVYEERLFWNASISKWVGEAKTVAVQQDNWAMDLGNKNATQLLDWSPINNPVPYGKAFALISGPLNLSASNFDIATHTGVITVDDTTSSHSFPFTDGSSNTTGGGGYLQIRDNYISFTGRTATTFTGCAVVQGTRGTIPNQEYISQGYPGGWGIVVNPILYAKELWAAGLRLQERFAALGNSGFVLAPVTEKRFLVAPYWYQFDQGDATVPIQHQIPPAGGLGLSATWTSPTGAGAPGGERDFVMNVNGWSDWPLGAPTKTILLPTIVGKMEAGGVYSGSVLDLKLDVRWTS